MKTPVKLSTVLPWFPGFYESILDSIIDQEIEMEMEGNPPDRPPRTYEEIEPELNYPACRLAICKDWLEGFNKETGLHLEMETLDSPREYNFTTDRLFCYISPEDLRTIAKARRTKEFQKVVEDTFTSRSGFMSFYPGDSTNGKWRGATVNYDHNQLGALLEAWLIREGWKPEKLQMECLEYCNESCQALWEPKHTPAKL